MSNSVSMEYLNSVLPKPAMSAQNLSGASIKIVTGGTPVPLPHHPNMYGFTVNADDTVFTAQEAGLYYISYSLDLTAGLSMSVTVDINEVASPVLRKSSTVLMSKSAFACAALLPLTADSTLHLTFPGLRISPPLGPAVGPFFTVITLP